MFKPKAIALALAMTASAFAGASHAAAPQPSVVIVHGAFADGSDWAKVVPLLQAEGIKVTVTDGTTPVAGSVNVPVTSGTASLANVSSSGNFIAGNMGCVAPPASGGMAAA